MTPRLASGVLVSALIRSAQAGGGAAAVLSRGDADAGGVVVILAQRGENQAVFERAYTLDGDPEWRLIFPKPLIDHDKISEYLLRRRAGDPDLWAVELDVADSERFAAEMTRMG